jgi:hypothetical protein
LSEAANNLRAVRRDGNAALLRDGEPQPVVHLGIRCIVPDGIGLRFPARSLAIWDRGNCLGGSGFSALARRASEIPREQGADMILRRHLIVLVGSRSPFLAG